MKKLCTCLSIVLFTLLYSPAFSANTVIYFDNITTSPTGSVPYTYEGFTWFVPGGDDMGVVSNAQIQAWCSRTSISGDYQVRMAGDYTEVTITPTSGTFNYVEAYFATYCYFGATKITLTGTVSGGGTVSHYFTPTSSYQRIAYSDMNNLTSLNIKGEISGSRGCWIMDDFTWNADAEIDIKGNGVSIGDGDESPSTDDHTDFGSADVDGGSVIRTFTIYNTGIANLTLGGTPKVAVSGTNAADFTVTSQPSSPVTPGSSTTFQVTFNPSDSGERTAMLSIANNDGDENPYNFDIKGTGTSAPEMNLKQGSTNIADGGSYDYGSKSLATNTDVTFTIENLGGSDLTLSGTPIITIGGDNADQFSVQLQPTSPVTSSGTTTFTIRFTPTSAGAKSAAIDIGNNDSDENPYTLNLSGTGSAPEMNLKQGSTNIADGGSYDYGNLPTDVTDDVVFTIENLGTVNLTLSGTPIITITGTDADQFSVQAQPTSPVAASDNTTFTIRFAPTSTGAKTADIAIANNDSDENPYNLTLNMTGVEPVPEMNLKQGSTDIADGGSYDFGTHTYYTNTDVVFTIENTGTGSLTLSGTPIITIGGANPGQFSVQAQPTSPVAYSNSTTFTIRYRPTSSGAKTATISIANNDDDENPYDLTLNAVGTPYTTLNFDDITSGGQTTVSNPYSGFTWTDPLDVVSDAQLGTWGCSRNSPSGSYQVRVAGDPPTVTVTPQAGVFSYIEAKFATYCFSPAGSITLTGYLSGGGTVVHSFTPGASYTKQTYGDMTDLTSLVIAGTGSWLFDDFVYQGTPEIDISQNEVAVADGGTYNFGAQTVGTSADSTFDLENPGTAILTLSGSPIITITGANADQFSVQSQPGSSVAISGTTNFTIRFSPTSVGVKTAAISIASNDSNENPYDITLQGTGQATVIFTNGADGALSFTQNPPTAPLNNWPLGQFSLQGNTTGGVLSAVTVTLGGTYTGLEGATPFRLYAYDSNDFSSAAAIGSDAGATGGTVTFSAVNDGIPATLRYYWVTADLGGTVTGTINGTIGAADALTLTYGALSGSSAYGLLNAAADTPLPVQLTDLMATVCPGKGIDITWKTICEINCQGFQVWRCDNKDGNYSTVSTTLIPGNGNSTATHEYSFTDTQVENEQEYWYKIIAITMDGQQQVFGPVNIFYEGQIIPTQYSLQQNYPNPFNAQTTIHYELPENAQVLLQVFNIRGELAQTLVSKQQAAGSYSLNWNGTARDGKSLPSGVYMLRLEAGSFTEVVKMIYAR